MPDPFLLDMSNQFVVTFLFTFAIVFGVIDLSKVFKGNRVVTAIVSLAIAAFASTYPPFTNLLWSLLPNITWFFIVMFLLAFIFKIFNVKKGVDPRSSMVIYGVILLFLITLGWWILERSPKIKLPVIGGGDNLLFLLGIIVILVMFWISMKAKKTEAEQAVEAMQKQGK